jgi:hypothetical protein
LVTYLLQAEKLREQLQHVKSIAGCQGEPPLARVKLIKSYGIHAELAGDAV